MNKLRISYLFQYLLNLLELLALSYLDLLGRVSYRKFYSPLSIIKKSNTFILLHKITVKQYKPRDIVIKQTIYLFGIAILDLKALEKMKYISIK